MNTYNATQANADAGAAIAIVLVWLAIGFTQWIGACVLAWHLGKTRVRGFWWGFWLGWIGVIVVACSDKKEPALSADELEIKKLEQQVRLNELRQKLDTA